VGNESQPWSWSLKALVGAVVLAGQGLVTYALVTVKDGGVHVPLVGMTISADGLRVIWIVGYPLILTVVILGVRAYVVEQLAAMEAREKVARATAAEEQLKVAAASAKVETEARAAFAREEARTRQEWTKQIETILSDRAAAQKVERDEVLRVVQQYRATLAEERNALSAKAETMRDEYVQHVQNLLAEHKIGGVK